MRRDPRLRALSYERHLIRKLFFLSFVPFISSRIQMGVIPLVECECPLRILIDQERGRDKAQRAQPLRVLRRQHHSEDTAQRLSAIMDGRAPKGFDDGEEVIDVGFDVESSFEIVGNSGLAEPSKIRTHDFVKPGEAQLYQNRPERP